MRGLKGVESLTSVGQRRNNNINSSNTPTTIGGEQAAAAGRITSNWSTTEIEEDKEVHGANDPNLEQYDESESAQQPPQSAEETSLEQVPSLEIASSDDDKTRARKEFLSLKTLSPRK